MKILFVIFVSAVCVNGSSANQKILNPIPVLRQLFEILRSGIKNGSPANNLPIMDPFKIETGEIDVQDKFVRLDANLTDLIIRGLGEFRVKDVQFSQDQIAVDVKLLFPKLYFESEAKSMKVILLVFLLVAAAAAAPNAFEDQNALEHYEALVKASPESRNFLVNALIRQLLEFLRNLIANGNDLFGIPPLDPLVVDKLNLDLPAGLINLNLNLTNAVVGGIGGFVAHRTHLEPADLSFDIDIAVPRLKVNAERYSLIGNILTAVPIYGDGGAEFIVEGFRFKAKLFLKQSANEKAVIIDRIENVSFEIPSFKAAVKGAIGGGDIDTIVNAVIDEVIVGYVNRFRGAISNIAGVVVVAVLNPILEQLDTWGWISIILPRP
ncbi:unnamed protein product [Leptosia nina]|uniref:Hemolymph juvenile hormone binding protein n=1 Tax=Leptosia nina TaxID=320188 RepID=A0AAV1JH67_9NEOP